MNRKLIILQGGSCGGKTTTEEYLRESHDAESIVSLTTRNPRDGEVDGEHYWFLNHEYFEATEKANLIEITPDWLYAVPVSCFDVGCDLIYSVINIEPALDIIDYVTSNNLLFDVYFVVFNVPLKDRIECMKKRGMGQLDITFRINREDEIDDVMLKLKERDIKYTLYSDSLNMYSQTIISNQIYPDV